MAARAKHFFCGDELEPALACGLGTCPYVVQMDALVQPGTGLGTGRLFIPVPARVLRSFRDRAAPSHSDLVEWGTVHRSQDSGPPDATSAGEGSSWTAQRVASENHGAEGGLPYAPCRAGHHGGMIETLRFRVSERGNDERGGTLKFGRGFNSSDCCFPETNTALRQGL